MSEEIVNIENLEEEKSSFKDIRNNIIAGVFIVIPVGITIWLSVLAFVFITDWAKNIVDAIPIPDAYKSSNIFIFLVRLFSLFVLLAFLYSVGHIAKYAVGKKLLSYADSLILRVPMLKTVYSTASQIMDTIKSSRTGMFSQVVLFEYPRPGIYSIGFVTSSNVSRRVAGKITEELIAVFLPTTPNPTSGFFLLVPKSSCVYLEIGIDEAMKMIVSGGALQPKEYLTNTSVSKSQNGGTNEQSDLTNNT